MNINIILIFILRLLILRLTWTCFGIFSALGDMLLILFGDPPERFRTACFVAFGVTSKYPVTQEPL